MDTKLDGTARKLAAVLPAEPGRRAFVFSTCASGKGWIAKSREVLAGRGFELVGTFIRTGLWTPGPFSVRHGHPNTTDIESARVLARGLQ